MTSLPAEVEEKLKVYRSVQADVQKLVVKRQQALSQFNENTLVKGELDLLEEGNRVFKLVGPAMLPVALDDARDNVSKRLEFIEGETKKADAAIESKQAELKRIGDEIAEIQQRMQAEAAAAARLAVADAT